MWRKARTSISHYTLFFISNTFISNTRLKSAKNQAKAKQHPEAELLLLENCSRSSSTYHPKIIRHILKNKHKCVLTCFHEIIRLIIKLGFHYGLMWVTWHNILEAVVWKCSVEKVFLEIWQNSQENRLWHKHFPENLAKFLRTIFYRTPSVAASDIWTYFFYHKLSQVEASLQNYLTKLSHIKPN